MKTIFCFNNGGSPGWLEGVAICEDGTYLAGHICSSEGFMRNDLGLIGNWKHELYDAHCGAGNWQLEWVDNPKEHTGLTEALRLNALIPSTVDEQASVTIPLTPIEPPF